jgi:hypothetical protein
VDRAAGVTTALTAPRGGLISALRARDQGLTTKTSEHAARATAPKPTMQNTRPS